MGSLLVGSPRAKDQGVRIFETLNKAILASVSPLGPIVWGLDLTHLQWEGIMSGRGAEVTPMIQAALIGQTFGLLSGVSCPVF
jgi:hypothetical protein